MSKPKFPRRAALDVARTLVEFLAPHCQRIEVAGSLRRGKDQVGDIEIVYVPKHSTEADGLFSTKQINCADRKLEVMLTNRTIEKRLNVRGHQTWGTFNKLARHTTSQIPVDLFETSPPHWFNYLVCRTGSADNNKRIAIAAQQKGWQWHPYAAGFTDREGNQVRVESEQDVFRLVGLPYLEPSER